MTEAQAPPAHRLKEGIASACRHLHGRQVVAVDRAKIAKAQILEKHPGNEKALDGAFETGNGRANPIASFETPGQLPNLIPELIKLLVGHDGREILRHGPDVLRYRPGIVVEDDEQILLRGPGII